MKFVSTAVVLAMFIAIPLSLYSEEDGAAIFKTKCSACHNTNGEGRPTMKMPAVKGTTLTAEKIVDFLANGDALKKMHAKPISGLTADQAKAVVDYVKSLK
jgi:mono/diheme cytochrome c family protein